MGFGGFRLQRFRGLGFRVFFMVCLESFELWGVAGEGWNSGCCFVVSKETHELSKCASKYIEV